MAYQPKSYKKFVATAATATLVASAVAPMASAAFSDVADRYKEAVDYLATEGIAEGYPGGKFGTDDNIKRQDAAVMIARVLGATPDGDYPDAGFTDVPADRQWAVNFLYEKDIVSGKAAGQFGANDFTQRDEMAKIIAGAYELTADTTNAFPFTDVSETFKQYVDALNEAGIAEGYENSTQFGSGDMVTRGQFALFIHRAEGSPVATPATPEVVSVSATNLKVVEINFGAAVDEDSVDTDSIDVADKAYTVELSEDGKTAYVIFTNALSQNEELELTVDGVKSASGADVKVYEETIEVEDQSTPELTKVESLNAKQLKVYSSEPLNFSSDAFRVLNNVEVDGVAVIAKVTPDYTDNSFVIEFPSIQEPGTYDIEISDLRDFAGFKAATETFEYTVIEDTVAPVIINAVTKNVNTIEVEFDEAVSVNGTFKVDGVSATATAVAGSNGTKFTLTNFGGLDLGAIVEVEIDYKGQEDVVGNEVTTEKTYTFKVSDDTALPTVEHALTKGNKLTLTFNKSMNTSAGTITVLDEDGEEITELSVSAGLFKANTNNTVIELSGSQLGLSNVDPAKYTVVLEDLKDATVRANQLPDTDLTFTSLDTLAPSVTTNYLVTADADDSDDDTVTFYFSEAMDTDTLKNLSNYNGPAGSFAATTGVSVDSVASNGKSVTITYPNARTLTEGGSTITVSALKDLAGNMIATTPVTRIAQASVELAVSSAQATNTGEVVVTFNTEVASIDPSFLAVEKDGVAYAVPTKATISSTDAKKVTFTLNKAIAANTTGYTVVENNETLATNVYGDKLAANSTFTAPVGDAIRPTVSSIAAGDTTDGDTTVEANSFTVSFSEAVVGGTIDFSTIEDSLLVSGTGTIGTIQLSDADYDVVLGKLGAAAPSATAYTADKFVVELTQAGINKLASNGLTVSVLSNGLVDTTNSNTVVASSASTVNVVAVDAPAATAYTVNYAAETTTQAVPATVEYSDDNWLTSSVGTGVPVALAPGSTTDFRVAAKDGVAAGAEQTITVGARAAAPVVTLDETDDTAAFFEFALNDRVLTADGLEYSIDGGTTWAPITDTTTVDASGAAVIQARTAATSSAFASNATADLNN